MSDGSLSSPNHSVMEPTPAPATIGASDSRVRFTTLAREEVSLYGTPKEEIMPNVNSSR